ncbi:hypothetical protein WICPIJ_001950 [Wickerhamomyces pijperi]|uniref:Uncharacterized protein n=1 Tax=Wickerhamomyces pijperi TaxID=599730 RepID=A0A9P8Q9W3_WICPI|nr:hypothetical protein WICPIJ_001950 [Wickerhamomyces pijperi]
MVDPVDATFDTIYRWSQYVQRSTQYVKSQAEQSYEYLSDSINSQISPAVDEQVSVEDPSLLSWKSIGPIVQTVNQNKTITILSIITSLITFKYLRSQNLIPIVPPSPSNHKGRRLRRRAERLANGARKDVVLIIGSITDPMTRHLAQDLEHRGYIVYITSLNSASETRFFQMEMYSELKALIFSLQDWEFNRLQLLKFNEILKTDHIPFQGAMGNKLDLKGVIVMNDNTNGNNVNGAVKGAFHHVSSLQVERCLLGNFNYVVGLFQMGLLDLCGDYQDVKVLFLQSVKLELPFNLVENLNVESMQAFVKLLKLEYPALDIKILKISGLLMEKLSKAQGLKAFFYKVFDMLNSRESLWRIRRDDVQFIGTGARFIYLFRSWTPNWLSSSYFKGYFKDGEST